MNEIFVLFIRLPNLEKEQIISFERYWQSVPEFPVFAKEILGTGFVESHLERSKDRITSDSPTFVLHSTFAVFESFCKMCSVTNGTYNGTGALIVQEYSDQIQCLDVCFFLTS